MAAGELLDHHAAGVVPVVLVLAARVPEPDDEQVERGLRLVGSLAAPGEAQPEVLAFVGAGLAGSFAVALGRSLGSALGALRHPAPSSPSSPSSSSSSGSSTRVGTVTLAITVSCGSSTKRTPATSGMSSSRMESPMLSALTSTSIRSGTSSGERLDRDLARDLLQRAALADARRVGSADELDADRRLDRPVEPHDDEVDVGDAAADRVALELLEDRGPRGAGDVDVRIAFSPWSPDSARRNSRSAIVIATGSAPPP